MAPRPTPPRETRLYGEQNQSRDPCDLRKQNRQHRRLAQHILSARKRTAKVQRQRAIGEVGRNQTRTREGGQEKRKHALHSHEIKKERIVDGEYSLGHADLLKEGCI